MTKIKKKEKRENEKKENRKSGIHANLAVTLEKTLKIDATYWLEAQKNYELDMARLEAKNIQLLHKIDMKLMKNEL